MKMIGESVAATADSAPPPLAWPSNFVTTTLPTDTYKPNSEGEPHEKYENYGILESLSLLEACLAYMRVHHENYIVRIHSVSDLRHLVEQCSFLTLKPYRTMTNSCRPPDDAAH